MNFIVKETCFYCHQVIASADIDENNNIKLWDRRRYHYKHCIYLQPCKNKK